MAETILCTVKDQIRIIQSGKSRNISSGFVEQYRQNHEQVMRKYAWRQDGQGARFMNGLPPQFGRQSQRGPAPDNARITGIAAIGPNEVVFSVAVGESSGIFRRSVTDDADSEGHILHDKDVLFEGITVRGDGKVAFSVRNQNGEWKLATSTVGCSRFVTITEGGSVDRNPAWDPTNTEYLYFDSAASGFDSRGRLGLDPREILRVNLSKNEIEEVLGSSDHDYVRPRIDRQGNLWCIRRPFATAKSPFFTFLDLVLLPIRLGKAIFRAIEFFTWRHTGETLATGGANPARIREAPQEMILDGIRIAAARNLRNNSRSGDNLPGIIPRSWELIRMDLSENITVMARGVCCFALAQDDAVVFSNGRHLFKMQNEERIRLGDADLPETIVVL